MVTQALCTMNPIKRLWRRFAHRNHVHQKLFLDALHEYVSRYVNENQLNEKTAQHYAQRLRNIHVFLASRQLTGLFLEDVKPRTMEDLRAWLFVNLATCGKRHASLHVDLCKRTIQYAVMMEYTSQNWISPIKGQRDKPKPVIHLTMDEVRKLIAYDFRSDLFNVVAKMFAFQCFTGLSYCELFTFKLTDINGRPWMDSTRDKTGKTEYVYMFDEARDILGYFGGHIPNVPNQTCNRILKEIAGILKIDKKLTTHVGRKTHATLLDEMGISSKTIARQLRNTERICEESYISKSHKRTENEFEKHGLGGKMLIS